MYNKEITDVLRKNIALLSDTDSSKYPYIPQQDSQLPHINSLRRIIELVKAVVFPGYFGDGSYCSNMQEYFIGVRVEELYGLLCEEIGCGLQCFAKDEVPDVSLHSAELAIKFIDALPELKRVACTDVKAVYDGDPAARTYEEVIFCYPAVIALLHYRVAHLLLTLGVPVIPRIISEMAHSRTGIDIHPGATIGEYFSIDHGTGVVIGETCIIGDHVRLYQGVTLGSKSFKFDADGNPLNIPRHPILEDYVTVYSNASILGRITIGHHSVIGGNVWQTQPLPPYSHVQQGREATITSPDGVGEQK